MSRVLTENAPNRPPEGYNAALDEMVSAAAELVGPAPDPDEPSLAEQLEEARAEAAYWREQYSSLLAVLPYL